MTRPIEMMKPFSADPEFPGFMVARMRPNSASRLLLMDPLT